MNQAGFPEIPGYAQFPHPSTDLSGLPKDSRLPDYCNHMVIERNKLPAHYPVRCLSTEDEALSCKFEEGMKSGDNMVVLTPPGTRWAFHFSDTNFQYPFKVAPPLIPDGMNHVGSYQTKFTVPSSWGQRRVFLCFEGVSSAFHLWVDGVPIGYSQDSRLNAEFDITRVCKPGGTHTMSLRVYRFCDGSYLEDQDMWWLSGVHRDVILYSKPAAAYIWDICAKPEVDIPAGKQGACSDAPGNLRVDVTVRSHKQGASDIPSTCSVTASLYGPHILKSGQTHADPPEGSEPVFRDISARFISSEISPDFEGGEQQLARLETSVGPVRLWNAEEPWLYTLVLTLKGEDGVVDVEVLRIGFRSLVCDGNKFLINGAVPYMYGVNRHEHDEHVGKYTDRDSMIADILLMKTFNFNAVRTSHYPNRSLWYALCDAYGLYVIDEANIETHGLALETAEDILANDPTWENSYVDRAVRMVLRDRNHPSIIMWSMGNEASYGRTHDIIYKRLKQIDSSRPVHYESCGGAHATDILCPMYPSVDKLRKMASLSEQVKPNHELGRSWPMGTHKHARPVIMCEYAHAMGNSTGNMDEYWDVIRSTDGLQGGFIWDWMDQGILRKTKTGKEYWAYGGDYGEVVHDLNFNINGLNFPNHTPHPGMYQVKYNYQPAGFKAQWAGKGKVGRCAKVEITSRFDFVTLSHLKLVWRVELDGKVIKEGTVASLPQTPPRSTCTVDLEFDLPSEQIGSLEGVLSISLQLAKDASWASAGHEVAWEQFALPPPPAFTIPSPALTHSKRFRVEDGASELLVLADGMSVAICKKRGGLKSFQYGGRELLTPDVKGEHGALLQNFWRCPTDNDQGGIDTVIGTKSVQMWGNESNNGVRKRVMGALSFAVFWANLWDDVSYSLKWRKNGIDRLAPTKVSVKVEKADEECVVVRCRYVLRGVAERVNRKCSTWELIKIRQKNSRRSLEGRFVPVITVRHYVHPYTRDALLSPMTKRAPSTPSYMNDTYYTSYLQCIACETVYTILASGEVVVSNTCNLAPSLPPLPRVGIQFSVAKDLKKVTWFGRGPHECYCDRRTGTPVGRYESKVEDMHVPYLFPSENGNRCDVRWLAVTDDKGVGLVIAPVGEGESVDFSAHNYTAHDLQAAMYDYEVVRRDEVTVTVDARHMGVGGTDTWSRSVLNNYLIPSGTHRYSVRLIPIASPSQIARPSPVLLDKCSSAVFAGYSYSQPFFLSMYVCMVREGLCLMIAKAPFKLVEQGFRVTKVLRQSPSTSILCAGAVLLLAYAIKRYGS